MTYAPSDIDRLDPDHQGARLTFGGRAVLTRDSQVLLTDAFASIPVELVIAEPDLATDDLLTIEGVLLERRIVDARVTSRRAPHNLSSSDVRRFRDRGVATALTDRARANATIRAYFEEERFVEVETPYLVPSPGLDRHLDAFAIEKQLPERFLITSPEYQMKRLLVGGVPRCFQMARCFRRAEVGGHHNPEFTMLEWYRANAGMDEIVRDTEEIIRKVVAKLAGRAALQVGERLIELGDAFESVTVAAAFRDLAQVSETDMLELAANDEERFFRILIDRIEPILAARPHPVVLHRYPAKMASLARLSPDDARYADRFEVYVAGLELSNGFVELVDPQEQRARLVRDQTERQAASQPVYPIDERFIEALAGGLPDCAGNALGLDRLVMLATGRTHIGDVLAFPEGVV